MDLGFGFNFWGAAKTAGTQLLFFQPFNHADGSGAFGGSTDDPTQAGFEFIQIADGVLKGTAPLGDGNNNTVRNTLTTPAEGGCTVSFNAQLLTDGLFDGIVFSFYDSTPSLVFTLVLFSMNTIDASISIKDKSNIEKGMPYDDAVLPYGNMTVKVDLVAKKVECHSSSWELDPIGPADISDGDTLESTNIAYIDVGIASALGSSRTDRQIVDNLKVESL